MTSSLRVRPGAVQGRKRIDSVTTTSTARAVKASPIWLNFADPKIEIEYQLSYARRMGKGFVGSVLGRSFVSLCIAIFCLVTSQTTSSIASFAAVAVDFVCVAIFSCLGRWAFLVVVVLVLWCSTNHPVVFLHRDHTLFRLASCTEVP